MIETVLRVTLAAFALGGAGLFAASRKVDAATRRVRFVKFLTYFVVIHVFLFAASAGFEALAALMFAIAAFGAYELYRGLASTSSFFRGTVAFVYTILATSMIVFAIGSTPARAVFVYLVVAAFDGFSQVAGQLFGRRKLVPRLSPAKTVEGTAGFWTASTACWWRRQCRCSSRGNPSLLLPCRGSVRVPSRGAIQIFPGSADESRSRHRRPIHGNRNFVLCRRARQQVLPGFTATRRSARAYS